MPADTKNTILAADVGGTKTLLGLAEVDAQGNIHFLHQQHYASQNYVSLESMLQEFLQNVSVLPVRACLAVAGPIQHLTDRQHSQLTNLPWELDSKALAQALEIPRVDLINDLQAIGYALTFPDDINLQSLHSAQANNEAPKLVVAAGTGLGVSLLVPGINGYRSYPSEGGHITFAPRDEEQQRLLDFMQQSHQRVSYERLISGNGLIEIYRYLLKRDNIHSAPLLNSTDPAAAIGTLGVESEHTLAGEAVALFCRLFGAFVGDLALVSLPYGGIYIAGGIAPKLLPGRNEKTFIDAYADKGRMQELVLRFPVDLIRNRDCGLLGATRYTSAL